MSAERGEQRMRRALAVLVLVLAMCGARTAAAADADSKQSAYRLSLRLDVPLLLIAGGMASSFLFLNETAPPACAPLCDRNDVNAFDRHFAGWYSKSWTTVGDVTTASILILVPAGLIIGNPTRGGLGDLLVVGEAVLVTSAFQVTASYAVGRPRPRVYGEEAPVSERSDPNAARSFFSGHVATCLAGTMVATAALWRMDRPRLGWAVLAVGLTGSALIGIARIAGGGHFPSDVVVGYAVGAGVGIAIPALHDLNIRAAPLALPNTAGLSVATTF
jgi:membrane-associated phospholipid phosphatase